MSVMPTQPLPEAWEWVRLGDVLTESQLPGTDGLRAKKLTVKLYGLGIHAKSEKRPGSDKTRYYQRRAGQFIYSKLDFLNGAFAIIPPHLDGFESTVDLPAFDVSGRVSAEYLLYYVARPEFYAGGLISADGTRKARRVHPSEFLDLFIPLPPLPVQRWIADALASVDEWLKVSAAQAESLESMKMSFINQILLEVDAEAAPVILSDVGTLQTGLQIGKKYQDALNEYPYLRVANVKDGYVDTNIIKTVKVPELEASRRMLKAGDVLITEGGDADKLGRGSIWQGQVEDCLHQNHIFAFRPDKRKLLPEYLALTLRGAAAKSYFQSSAKQTTNLASINSTQLKAFSLRVPSLKSQRQAVQKAQELDNWINAERNYFSEVLSIRQSLLYQLLSGSLQPQGGWASVIQAAAP